MSIVFLFLDYLRKAAERHITDTVHAFTIEVWSSFSIDQAAFPSQYIYFSHFLFHFLTMNYVCYQYSTAILNVTSFITMSITLTHYSD